MRIEPFQMERWQSLHEHDVEINLSDSGVHPLTLRELFEDPHELESVLDERLVYTQTNGTAELRRLVAALYPGAGEEHVEIVNGGAEANFLATWSLVEHGDEVVVMTPNYMQVPGIVRALGAEVRAWALEPDLERARWRANLAHLAELVTPRTRMIALCNPNNPTGMRLRAEELDEVCRIADTVGAWVLSDEIYQGSELDGETTATAWGRCERVIVTNSLSKAYGLPGLRLGWIVTAPDRAAELWSRHDYTTIAPGALSDRAARTALRPAVRERLLARSRRLLGHNLGLLTRWLVGHADTLSYAPPEAGAIIYLRYAQAIGSSELADRLRREQSVLLVPGDHFGMDGWLRIGFGGESIEIERGLERIHALLGSLSI